MIDSFQHENRFLSNFWDSPVLFEGRAYPTVEHAYQAAKTLDPAARERIQYADKPGQAKRLGQQVELRPDWEDIKIDVMRVLIADKFAPGTKMAELLLATELQNLVEGNHWGDTFWGVCSGVGENFLGRILMSRRAELRDAADDVEYLAIVTRRAHEILAKRGLEGATKPEDLAHWTATGALNWLDGQLDAAIDKEKGVGDGQPG